MVFTTNRPRLFQGAPLAVQLTDPPSSLTVSIWGKCWRPISRSCFIPCVFQFDSSVPEMWILSIPQMLRQPGDHHGYWYQLAKRQDEQSTLGSLFLMYSYELLLAKNAYQLIWSFNSQLQKNKSFPKWKLQTDRGISARPVFYLSIFVWKQINNSDRYILKYI